jgi:hypothetical protein
MAPLGSLRGQQTPISTLMSTAIPAPNINLKLTENIVIKIKINFNLRQPVLY